MSVAMYQRGARSADWKGETARPRKNWQLIKTQLNAITSKCTTSSVFNI